MALLSLHPLVNHQGNHQFNYQVHHLSPHHYYQLPYLPNHHLIYHHKFFPLPHVIIQPVNLHTRHHNHPQIFLPFRQLLNLVQIPTHFYYRSCSYRKYHRFWNNGRNHNLYEVCETTIWMRSCTACLEISLHKSC